MEAEKLNKLRKKLWKQISNTNDFWFSEKIKNWYSENDEKVFKGTNGFTFIKNEVFGSDEELFLSLYNTLN